MKSARIDFAVSYYWVMSPLDLGFSKGAAGGSFSRHDTRSTVLLLSRAAMPNETYLLCLSPLSQSPRCAANRRRGAKGQTPFFIEAVNVTLP